LKLFVSDFARCRELMRQYSDLPLGLKQYYGQSITNVELATM
jgi:hypothetical protein